MAPSWLLGRVPKHEQPVKPCPFGRLLEALQPQGLEDQVGSREAEAEAAALASADTVARMLKPLHSLVDRLKEYQGQKGERFHNSLIQNVIDGCDLASKLAINPSADLTNEINTLRDAAKACLADAEIIKGSANARDAARAKLEAVANRMAAFG